MTKPKMLRWVVEVEVDAALVADGFNPRNNEEDHCERIEQMLRLELPFARPGEVAARVVRSPATAKIAKLQGYTDINEYYQSITE